jgi:hypothetical protein
MMIDMITKKADFSGLEVSQEFRQVLGRGLEPLPGDRYPNAAEFLEAIKATPEWQTASLDSVTSY